MYDHDEWCPPVERSEFEQSLHDLIETEVKARIGETVETLEMVKRANEQLSKKNKELYTSVKKHDSELKVALIEKEKEVKRTIFDGFLVGDKVWRVESKDIGKIPCKCNNTKKIFVEYQGSTIEVPCPDCANKNYWNIAVWEYTPKKDEIRWLTVSFFQDRKSIKLHLSLYNNEQEPKDVFRTLEECQKYCDEKNARERDKLGN